MNLKDTVISQINHIQTDRVPYTLGFQDKHRGLLDDFYGMGQWRNRIKPYINHAWVMDCLKKTWLDDIFTKDIYGNIWRDDGYTAHLEVPSLTDTDLKGYTFPEISNFFSDIEYSQAYESINTHSDSFNIIHIPWGLFEKSWTLRGFENALADMVLNKKFYHELIHRITEHIMGFVEIAIKYPVDGVMFGDDWGGQDGVFMGKDRWNEFFREPYEMLYGKVHKAGKYVLSHCCGNIVDILPDVIDIGLDVYESFQPETMDIYKVKKGFGKDITFWGGIGAQSLIPFGTPDDINNEVKRMRSELSNGGGFILGVSKEPPEETPIENLVALIESFTEGK